jgi:hypothetical protein
MHHRFEVSGAAGQYRFLYDQPQRHLCLVQWPDGRSAMRILACGLPKTLDDAVIAAEKHIGYIEGGFPNC